MCRTPKRSVTATWSSPTKGRSRSKRRLSTSKGRHSPPEVLKGYEEVLEGAPDRIVKMAEDEALHRRATEHFELRSGAKLGTRGQVFGLVLAVVFLIGGMVLIGLDRTQLGTAAVIGAVMGLSVSGLFLWASGKGRDLSPPKRRPR